MNKTPNIIYANGVRYIRADLASKRLHEAAQLICDWGAYAPQYFREKHDLKGDIEKINGWADWQLDLSEQIGVEIGK